MSNITEGSAVAQCQYSILMNLFWVSFKFTFSSLCYKRKYVHKVLVNCLVKLAQKKSVVRWTYRPDMTIAVDWDVKVLQNPKVCYVKLRWSHPSGISPGRVAQSVTCLATDACLTADPGVASSIPARYHTFVEIDQEIISTVILLPSADLFKKGCCQLQAKVCAQITGWTACSSLPRKKCG